MKNYLFDKQWFKVQQKKLLWLLNKPIIKYWFRWVLRINKDCSFKEKISEITPNSFTIYLGKNGYRDKYRTDFRTHNKYSKRIYYAFYPLWFLFHCWDILIANRFAPELNLGFDTLTVYPDTGTGSTTCDGYMEQSYGANAGEVWATIIAAAGSGAAASGASGYACGFVSDGAARDGKWVYLWRSGFTFDTSDLTAGATISAATFSLYGSAKADNLFVTPNINIYSFAPAANNNIVAGDYDSLGSTAYCDTAVTYNGWSTAGYNDFALNATGLAAISKTGVTKIGARNANFDAAASSPTWTASLDSNLNCYFADEAETTKDPKLVITYTALTLVMGTGSFTLTGQAVGLKCSRKIAMAVGSFTLTGKDVGLKCARKLVMAVGSFILTGKDLSFRWLLRFLPKHTSSYTNKTKNTSSYTNETKNSSSWSYKTKN